MNALEISIKMETDAINFYKEAASKVSSEVGSQMFLSIAEDEKRHLQMLKSIVEGLEITVADVSPMDNVKTIFEELKDEMMKKVQATGDDLEAFGIAMRMEREGREFYEKSAAGATTEKEKALFERLAKEEEEHYRVFANSHSFLSDTGNWFMWEEKGIVEGG